MNNQNLFALLPILAFGACAQPESAQVTYSETAPTVEAAQVAVNRTVVLNVTGAT